MHVYSNASGTFGCRAVVEGIGWFQVQCPEDWEGTDIAARELVPVVAAAALWGKKCIARFTQTTWLW